MKEILITTLLLGCLIAFTSAQRGLFEFHDSYGRCWRCLPGSACVRCPTHFVPLVSGHPDPWDRTCAEPSKEYCALWPGVKFPHVDIGFYWICADEGVVIEVPCFCDLIFDMRAQECVKSDALESIGCNAYANTDPHDCMSEEERPPPVTFPPDVTSPTTTADPSDIPTVTNDPSDTTTAGTGPTISVPTVPNDPSDTTTTTTPTGSTISVPTVSNEGPTTTEYTTTTTTTINGGGPTDPDTTTTTTTTTEGPTRTTEIGGPGASPHPTDDDGGNGDDDETTTPPPCVCIVWWPCWCNPCWNMPCHSCNGCVGMMG